MKYLIVACKICKWYCTIWNEIGMLCIPVQFLARSDQQAFTRMEQSARCRPYWTQTIPWVNATAPRVVRAFHNFRFCRIKSDNCAAHGIIISLIPINFLGTCSSSWARQWRCIFFVGTVSSSTSSNHGLESIACESDDRSVSMKAKLFIKITIVPMSARQWHIFRTHVVFQDIYYRCKSYCRLVVLDEDWVTNR